MKRKNQKKAKVDKQASCTSKQASYTSSEHETSESSFSFDANSIPQYVIPSECNVSDESLKLDFDDNAMPCLEFLIPDVELSVDDTEEIVIRRRKRRNKAPKVITTNKKHAKYTPYIKKQRKSGENLRLRLLKQSRKEKRRKENNVEAKINNPSLVLNYDEFGTVKCEPLECYENINDESDTIFETDSIQTVTDCDTVIMKCEPEETQIESEFLNCSDTGTADQVFSDSMIVKCELQNQDTQTKLEIKNCGDIISDQVLGFKSEPWWENANTEMNHDNANMEYIFSNTEENMFCDREEEMYDLNLSANPDLNLGESSDGSLASSCADPVESGQLDCDESNVYYACPFCLGVFFDEHRFKKHIFCNANASVARYTHTKNVIGNSEQSNLTYLECKTCKTKFSSFVILREHLKTHNTKKETHVRNYCRVCSTGFSFTCSLTRHQKKMKHDIDCLQCFICKNIFSNYQTFEEHAINNHDGRIEFGCHQCMDKFSTIRDIIDHTKSVKEDKLNETYLRPFCIDAKFCSLGVNKNTPSIQIAFKSRLLLNSTVFSCIVCKYRFSKIEYVEQHFLSVHKDLLQMSIKCDFKPNRCETESNLTDQKIDSAAPLKINHEVIVSHSLDVSKNDAKEIESKESADGISGLENNLCTVKDENTTKLSLVTFQPKKPVKVGNAATCTKKLIGIRKILPIKIEKTSTVYEPAEIQEAQITNTIPPNATDVIASDLFQKICDARTVSTEYLRECKICHGSFYSYATFSRHYEKCQLLKSVKIEEGSGVHFFAQNYKTIKNLIKIHAPYFSQPAFLCYVCNFSINNRTDFLDHFNTHQTILYYTCFLCSELFSDYYPFHTHVKKHANVAIFCGYCNVDQSPKNYFNFSHLQIHGLNICSFCGTIPTSTTIPMHIAFHKKLRTLHQCPVCKKYFLSKFNVELHIFNVHKSCMSNEEHFTKNTVQQTPEEQAMCSNWKSKNMVGKETHLHVPKLNELVVDELIVVEAQSKKIIESNYPCC